VGSHILSHAPFVTQPVRSGYVRSCSAVSRVLDRERSVASAESREHDRKRKGTNAGSRGGVQMEFSPPLQDHRLRGTRGFLTSKSFGRVRPSDHLGRRTVDGAEPCDDKAFVRSSSSLGLGVVTELWRWVRGGTTLERGARSDIFLQALARCTRWGQGRSRLEIVPSNWINQERRCARCGYPVAKSHSYEWSKKANRRRKPGKRRQGYIKTLGRRFKNSFREGTTPPRVARARSEQRPACVQCGWS
jgi:hypothetical protein